ncbi:hypothetical protein [Methylovulum psychrotolerans]|uniref:hypothetical protein n=1 Tax=Methylovulum psychrotolerans TaxID=1704499 RepID=UPI000CDF03EA|nr:hypothetical protein [Methylovulum psychrotolerans]
MNARENRVESNAVAVAARQNIGNCETAQNVDFQRTIGLDQSHIFVGTMACNQLMLNANIFWH